MGDDDLLNFIIKSRERGRQDDQIIQQLISVGWRKEKIDGAFIRLREMRQNEKRGTVPSPPPQAAQQQAAIASQPQQSSAPQQAASAPTVQQAETTLRQQSVIPSLSASPESASPAQPAQPPIDLSKKKGFSLPSLGIFGKKAQPAQQAPVQTAPQQPAPQAQPTPQQQAYSQTAQPAQPLQTAQMASSQAQQQPAPQQPADSGEMGPQRAFPSLDGKAGEPKKGIFQNRLVMYTIIILFGIVLAAVIYYAALAPMMAGGVSEAKPASRTQKPSASGGDSSIKVLPQNASFSPEQAQAEFERIMGLQANLTYTADYVASFGGAQIPTTLYAKTSSKKRTDTSLFGESRSYTLYGESYSCSKQNNDWICTNTTQSEQYPPESGSMETNPSLFRAAWNGTQKIANANASCFLVSDQSNQTSRRCYSPEGVQLLSESIPAPGKQATPLGMAAIRYNLSADDSLFALPAAPKPLFRPLNSSSQPTALPVQTQQNTSPAQPQAPAPIATAPAPNASASPAATPLNFTKTAKYTVTFPYNASKFCWNVDGVFTRAHYKSYWGGDCSSEKGVDGFDTPEEFSLHCSESPCCYNGPMKEYSKKYDYIECGFY